MQLQKCRRSDCDQLIDLNSSGNLKYCRAADGKKGCYTIAKNRREKERKVKNEIIAGREAALLKTLKDLTFGHRLNKITVDRFYQLIYDYLDLFETRTLQEITIKYYENFELFKVFENNQYLVAINKK